ncbi:MAG: family 43 glycosylhydrolase [Armatimonadetes bacterium]|nr:family 43 glycosylhydrolase [Armatimonadota bacterium]
MLIAALAIHAIATGLPMQRPDDNWSIFPGDGAYAEHSENTHDPMIIDLGGQVFCLSTSGNGFGVMKSTKDFKTWKVWGPIIPEAPDWLKKLIPEHRSIWAPDAVQVGKSVCVYYCASRYFGGNDSVIGFLQNDHFDPEKPHDGWVDHGKVIESSKANGDHYNCIDPDVKIDEAGRHWLYFGSYYSGLYVVELDPETGKIKDGAKPAPVANNKSSRENALEGAAQCYRDGYYYLFVSYGLAAQGVRSTYQIMVGRSKTPDGPFVDANGTTMTDGGHVNFLKTSPPMFSPGHCEILHHSDGRWLMSYHYYDGRRFWVGDKWGLPRLQVREVLWSKDGWPLPGLPVEYLNTIHLKEQKSMVGKWIHQADFTDADEVEFRADGTIKTSREDGKWSLDGKMLTLRWPKFNSPGEYWTDAVQLEYKGNYYVGRNQQGMVIRGVRSDLK